MNLNVIFDHHSQGGTSGRSRPSTRRTPHRELLLELSLQFLDAAQIVNKLLMDTLYSDPAHIIENIH